MDQSYESVDQTITALTRVPAGEVDARGRFTRDSGNDRVAARRAGMAGIQRLFTGASDKPKRTLIQAQHS